jgi:hypothetical protein
VLIWESAEGAQCEQLLLALARPTASYYFAPSALNGVAGTGPGALPQGVAFRAVGAFKPVDQQTLARN